MGQRIPCPLTFPARRQKNWMALKKLQRARLNITNRMMEKCILHSRAPNLSLSTKTDISHTCPRLAGALQIEDRVPMLTSLGHSTPRGDKETVELQPPPRLGWTARVPEPPSPSAPTQAYSPPKDEFPPLSSNTSNQRVLKEDKAVKFPLATGENSIFRIS